MKHILLVEDDEGLAGALQRGLREEGYLVSAARDVATAESARQATPPDLLLLDLLLPDQDGLEYLGALREGGCTAPVIVMTARGSVAERLEGFRTGADDYVVKPFALAELFARIAAVLRRAQAVVTQYCVDDLRLDTAVRQAERNGSPLDLTPREFDLLVYLARFEGRPVSRDMLSRDVWRLRSRATSLDNVIDVAIGRLRRKLDLPGQPPLLHTVRGLGFRLGVDA